MSAIRKDRGAVSTDALDRARRSGFHIGPIFMDGLAWHVADLPTIREDAAKPADVPASYGDGWKCRPDLRGSFGRAGIDRLPSRGALANPRLSGLEKLQPWQGRLGGWRAMVNAPAFLHPLLRHAVQLLWREARLLLPLPLLRLRGWQVARQQAGGHRREYDPTHHGSFLIHTFTLSRPDANGNMLLTIGPAPPSPGRTASRLRFARPTEGSAARCPSRTATGRCAGHSRPGTRPS